MNNLLRFPAILRGVSLLFAAIVACHTVQAQYPHVPDRCPEPCRIGGTHVTPDYQRMTVPFFIRNADTGQYLMLDDREKVAVAPLVENDHSFLWVLMRGPRPDETPGDVFAMTRDNGFEEDSLYKLINLQASRALMRRGGDAMVAAATYEGANQYFLLRKNTSDDRYIFYNPSTTSTFTEEARRKELETQWAAYHTVGDATGVRDTGIELQKLRGRIEVSVDAAEATFATMPALMVPAGQNKVMARPGANFGARDFSWHLDEAPEPLDLARLTIKRVQIFKPSDGFDSDTDWAIAGADFVAGLAHGWGMGQLAKKVEKELLKEAAREGSLNAWAKLGEKVAEEAAEQAAQRAVSESVEVWAIREFTDRTAPTVGSIYKRLLSGASYVAATPFRAGWWVSKVSGSWVGRKLIKVAADKARPIIKAATTVLLARKKGLGTVAARVVLWKNKAAITKFLGTKLYSFAAKPYMKELLGDAYVVPASGERARPGRTLSERDGNLGGELGDLKAELAELEKKWGGDQRHFAALNKKILNELNEIDPNVAYLTWYDNYTVYHPLNYDPTAPELQSLALLIDMNSSVAYEFYLEIATRLNAPTQGQRKYFPLDYVPEQTWHQRLFTDRSESDAYESYLDDLKKERKAVERAQTWRPLELEWIRKSKGMSEKQAAAELRDVRKRLIDAENKEFALKTIESRIKEIEDFRYKVTRSEDPSLIVADPRLATYDYPLDISDDTYRECMDTKPYAIPVTNGPYGRLASAQVRQEIPKMTKAMSGIIDGSVTGGDAALVSAMWTMDVLLFGIGSIANEFKKLSALSDDQLRIYVDDNQVWPKGGSGYNDIGKSSQRQRVDVEHIFRRGDTVTIKLVEDDGSSTDHLGSLKISSTHLFDRESHDTVYIASESEGSLYAVDVELEPYYAPTPKEAARQRAHQRDCAPVVKQAEGEEFAFAVEKARIEGRLALLKDRRIGGADAVKTFDANVGWADQQCPRINFSSGPLGEWRVGRYDKFGRRDRSVTWTTTIARIDSWGEDDWIGEGLIVTPSETGIWNTQNWSSMYFQQDRKVRGEDHSSWSEPALHSLNSSYSTPFVAPVRQSHKSCEIYALMYGKDGMLGSLGREFTHPWELLERQKLIDEQLKTDPILIAERAKLQKYINEKGDDDPYLPRMRKELRRKTFVKRLDLEKEQREKPKDSLYNQVENERVFALRGDATNHGQFRGKMYGIANKRSPEFKAVKFLNTFYSNLPENKSGVDANLLFKASGPANIWMERISEESIGNAAGANTEESEAIIRQIKQTIAGSWAVAPYIKQKSFRKKQRRANPKKKAVWHFTANGAFIAQPENDFWFTPPIEGRWKYIGDQRIEVTTKAPVQIKVTEADGRDSETGLHDFSSRFIIKMAQQPNSRTKFSGFFIQGSNGQKIAWSKKLHPGKTPFEAPELYSEAFFSQFMKYAERDGRPIPAAFRNQAKANKTAMATKLAELEALKNSSPCNIEEGGRFSPDHSPAFHPLSGNWRVGQYSPNGEKQYQWNYYNSVSAPHWFHSEDEWRILGVTHGTYRGRKFEDWRRGDWTAADDPTLAFVRPNTVERDGYQQQWSIQSQNLVISTRTDGGTFRYKEGQTAPISAMIDDLDVDPKSGKFILKFRKGYSDHVKQNGLGLQKINSQSVEGTAIDNGCRSSKVRIPNLAGGVGETHYAVNMIYHKNGDKEFYLTRPDGSLFLWGMQDPDRTKHSYRHDLKIISPEQVALACLRALPSRMESRHPFDYDDNTIPEGATLLLQNDGAIGLRLFLTNTGTSDARAKTKSRGTLSPGEYRTIRQSDFKELNGTEFDRLAVIEDREEYTEHNMKEVCVGLYGDKWGYLKFGEGFPYETKHIDAEAANASCGESISPDDYPGRPAVVEFRNNGSTPLEVYRLGRQGSKINKDGTGFTKKPDHSVYRDADFYNDLRPMVTVEPYGSAIIRTVTGHAFKAIKRGDRRMERQYIPRDDSQDQFEMIGGRPDLRSYGDGAPAKTVEREVGDPEKCFGQLKLTAVSEIITLGDGVPREVFEANEKIRIQKENELKIAEETGCIDFGKAASKSTRGLGATIQIGNSSSADHTVHWIDPDGKYDADRPAMVLKPGQSAVFSDFDRAKYQVLDGDKNCVGIAEARGYSTKTFGDGSTPVTGKVIDWFNYAGIVPQENLTDRQIANGCDLFGKTTSEPTPNTRRKPKIVYNGGNKPLNLFWVSFNGTLENAEIRREPKPYSTVAAGQRIRLPVGTAGTVTAVLEENGDCVAMLRDTDNFSLDWGVPSRQKADPNDMTKLFYVHRDKDSAAAFEERVAQWKRDPETHKTKVAELEELKKNSKCSSNRLTLVKEPMWGEWEVGDYDRGGRKITDDTKIWAFPQDHREKNARADRTIDWESFEKYEDCTFKMDGADKLIWADDGSHMVGNNAVTKLFINEDGGQEFYTIAQRVPAILYEDGTTETPTLERNAWDSYQDWERTMLREWLPENEKPRLIRWGRKLPSVSQVVDADPAVDEVFEDASIGDPVGIIAQASDPDSDVTYSLGDKFFQVDPKSGVITVKAALDYETAATHKLYVYATSTDTSSSSMEVDITVLPVNEAGIGDIIISFGHNGMAGPLAEDTKVGEPAGITARATDPDTNDTIRYELTDDAGGLFAINADTGVITVAGKLDWEAVKGHTVEVTATSSDGSSSNTHVEIPLEDSDEFPVSEIDDADPRPDAVDENAPIGTEVGVAAFAVDNDGSATVSYDIDAWTENGTDFKIDPQSGILTLNTELDREFISSLDIKIKAISTDNSGRYSTSERTFKIAVNDVNEFDITDFDFDSGGIQVNQDAVVGTRIYWFGGPRDQDATDEVTFSIANAEDVPFVIDPKIGNLTVGRSLKEAEVASYTLEIVADSTDGSQSRKTFVVAIEDVDDFGVSELIDTDDTPNAVDENAKSGALVGITVFADDPDASDEVTYSISENPSPYSVDPETGVITVSGYSGLDAETNLGGTVRVMATSSPRSTNSFEFKIAINDINEYEVRPPVDTDDAPDQVKENAPVGTAVGITAFAEDRDLGDTVTYRMAQPGDEYYNSDDDMFAIDPITGVITVARPIDYETTIIAYISVFAVSSDGAPPEVDWNLPQRRFEIKILPENEFDLTPFFDTDEAPNEIADSAGWGASTGITLTTSDADEGAYEYRFTIVDAAGNDDWGSPFSVGSDGSITINHENNKLLEMGPGPHTLFVKATSNDGSERIEEVTINIIGPDLWRNNPRGPRVEADFPTVRDDDRQRCLAADEDRSVAETFNNEVAYFDCLEQAVPIVLWRDNPRGPRVESTYTTLTQSDFDYCRSLDEDASRVAIFNNENAYFDCLDLRVPLSSDGISDSSELACATQFDLVPEVSEYRAMVTITNAHSQSISIRRLRPDGEVTHITDLAAGQTSEIQVDDSGVLTDPKRRIVLVGIDPDGTCVGAGKPRESHNSFTFGAPGTFLEGPGTRVNTDGQSGGDTGGQNTGGQDVVDWNTNPQDPRANNDYNAVSDTAYYACGDANTDANSPSFNNETAYWDCLDLALSGDQPTTQPDTDNQDVNQTAADWTQSPQDPRYSNDYTAVSDDDYNACGQANNEVNSPSFNNETAYWNCLDAALGGGQQAPQPDNDNQDVGQTAADWTQNPQDPRSGNDYNAVSDDQYYACGDANVDVSSPAYNDETAYWDCLDVALNGG